MQVEDLNFENDLREYAPKPPNDFGVMLELNLPLESLDFRLSRKWQPCVRVHCLKRKLHLNDLISWHLVLFAKEY